jgi:cytidylate kinase
MIVTVSRAYGAAGQAVSRRAAERLGYRLLDEQLDVVVATRLGTSPDVVESVGDRPRGFGERVMEQLGGGLPELAQPAVSRDDDLVAERKRGIELAVREAAEAGAVVIVGRMGGAILAARSDVLRVYVSAPVEWRIAHVAESLGLSEAKAKAEIARIDEARRDYAREHYRVSWGDARNYHLVLDTARFGAEGAGDVIAAAVRAAGG